MTERLLDGKTVVVTGAARGLGAAIATSCAEHGARVVVTDVLDEELRATAQRLGGAATAHFLDVSDPGSWATFVGSLGRDGVVPDALVNNAGIIRAALLRDASHDDLMRSLSVNVGGVFLGMQSFLEMHLRADPGRARSIVNISSVRGLIGGSRAVSYSASKFAVRGLTKSAAVELGPLGIRVNSVCPGPIESDMSLGNPQFEGLDWSGYVANLPLPRMGRPVDIGEAVAWLASDASAFVTGIDLPVDGGLTATSYSVASPADLPRHATNDA